MTLIASLPWYDLSTSHPQLDDFWRTARACLASHLQEGSDLLPRQLDRTTPLESQWQSPDLLISQCCGPDLFTPHAGELIPVARPVFSDLDCQPGNYFSHIVTAASPRSGKRLVVNSPSSRSGCNALLEWFAAQGWQADQYLISGSHEASLQLIRDGLADYAAIDAHSWNLLSQADTDNGIVIIDRSSEAPAPPYVTHRHGKVSAEQLCAALSQAAARHGGSLGITGILPTGIDEYRSMRIPAATGWRCSAPLADHPAVQTDDNLPWQISCS
ncbi:phosphate/phosphite/phosphonate ABC transporter substrate-binding protein [Aliamphritea hakodatensis]|uniref:phosphate/phosphite/phosphonate ABC transporter substrate-binding protein n=1 Tax=Aliamphritea hakodatensis TaxID=2895352 RepID=UPI0022FD9EC1|nr:PhnD/SsuA/transferrin family substrate-binding protein [Aliamphritea hakodatensis]